MSTKPPAPPKKITCLDLSAQFPVGGSLKAEKRKKYQDKSGVLLAAVTLVNANSQKGDPAGKYTSICIHWQVTNGLTLYDDYPIVQAMDIDGEPVMIRTVARNKKGQHLHMRNTGCMGLAFAAMGPGEIGAIRIEQMAKCVAEFCRKNGLDPRAKLPNGFWVLDDHAAYAKVDYPGARWDVGSQLPNLRNGKPDPRNIMAPLRKKTHWYYDETAKPGYVYEFTAVL